MNKVFLVIAALLLISGGAWQWWRTDQELNFLDAKIAAIKNELQQIDRALTSQAIIEEAIEQTQRKIAFFRKRLPLEPNIDPFVQEAGSLFKKHNLEFIPVSIDKVDKDFYSEIRLVFSYEGDAPDKAILNTIFKDFERIVHWQLSESEHEIDIIIYSSTVTQEKPRVKPCSSSDQSSVLFWPLAYQVQDKLEALDKLCLERNKNEDVQLRLDRFEKLRKLQAVLEKIVQSLDPQAAEQILI